MDLEELRNYCLVKPGVTASFPFGETTLVFKVLDKVFALVALDDSPLSINLKCDPEVAIELRERYGSVLPGYHMNKKYWNTVLLDGSIRSDLIRKWIDTSYGLVLAGLPKGKRLALARNSP